MHFTSAQSSWLASGSTTASRAEVIRSKTRALWLVDPEDRLPYLGVPQGRQVDVLPGIDS